MSVATKLATIDDLMAMPTDEPWELWEGELRKEGGVGGTASGLAGWIFALIIPYVMSRDLGWLTTADGTFIVQRQPDTTIVPDVGFIRWERLPERRSPDGFVPAPPDLAIEVISPSDGPADVAEKMERYRAANVPLVWWVDPNQHSVAVYRQGALVAVLHEGDELDGEALLPGFRLSVSRIFAYR